MGDYLLTLMNKYRSKGILIDANILLLYIVGSIDVELIGRFGRTANKFIEDDFYFAAKFIEYFEVRLTTPHILTEVSNLIGGRTDLQAALRLSLAQMNEEFVPGAEIRDSTAFVNFGLTDSAIAELAKDSYLVFTDDNPLYGYLTATGIEAVNLNQIKNN